MWKIGKIQWTSIRDTQVYGFDISNGLGKALISCCYATEQQAQAAAMHMCVGIEQALAVQSHAQEDAETLARTLKMSSATAAP